MTEEKQESKSKFWMFTINNPLDNDFENIPCEYMIWQLEEGEKKTQHIQGYICFTSQRHFTAVQKLFYKTNGTKPHLEKRMGKHSEAKGYCSKMDTRLDGPYEVGTDSEIAEGKGSRSDMIDIRNKIDANVPEKTIWQENFGSYTRYYKALREYKNVTKKIKLKDTEERMQWYYGESGTGKSRKAREENPEAYLKMCNKRWDNYRDEEVVIIEDFDKDHKVLCHHLKIWADRYPFPAEYKGGKMEIRPKLIIVTSNYHPRDIREDEKDLNPILRRFHCTHFHLPLVNN
nr:MAG TPA: Rep protein [Cressdnaviricota sp.]